MNKSIFSLLTIVLFSTLFSCKKYDEGPALSFHSKKARLANKWKYNKIYVNKEEKEIDSDEQQFRLEFDKEGLAIKTVSNASGPASFVGSYDLIDHKEKLKTAFYYTYFGNPVNDINEYDIIKLKNKELWLKEDKQNGDTYEYHFVPQ
jgi:hypothetical protein